MNEWSGKFVRVEQTQYGPKVVFASQKGEWKPMDIGAGVDVGPLEPGQQYKIFAEKNERGYMYLARFEKKEFDSGKKWFGGGKAYDPLNFVSNVIGQAIQAQLIKDPGQIAAWAKAAWAVTKEPGSATPGL
jgi:hypothetical protein